MKYTVNGSETVVASQVTSELGTTDISRRVMPQAGRNAAKRNFILQLGFEDPAPAVVPLQYSALVFQPKVVVIGVVAGILFQSPAIFAALGALLWWSALFPKLNPFNALYNRTTGSRPGAFRLGPSPAPRPVGALGGFSHRGFRSSPLGFPVGLCRSPPSRPIGADPATPLTEGQEMALLPPVSGGYRRPGRP